jgi:hypothetical protein
MFSDILQKMGEDCKFLSEDVAGIAHEVVSGDKTSRKSLEKTTILRKNTEELVAAEKEDPNVQFIKDKITDIFGR